MKKITVLFIVFIMMCNVCISALAANSNIETISSKLYSLGVIDTTPADFKSQVTRADMVKYIMRLISACGDVQPVNTEFSDVGVGNPNSGYISMAYAKKIISMNDAKKFEPDRAVLYEETVKMLVSALGYDAVAQREGGYPTGYLNIASEIGLLDNVNSWQGNFLSLYNVITLLDNALMAPVAQYEYFSDGKYNLIMSKSNENLLTTVYNADVYKVYVEEMPDSSTFVANVKAVKSEKHLYNINDRITVNIPSGVNVDDILYTYAEIIINEDNELLSASVDSNIDIMRGYIDEINKEHIKDSFHNPTYIENIALINYDEYLEVSENCKFYFNGELIDNKAEAFTGSFAKVVLCDDEIIAVDAWKLTEGGIVTSVDTDSITYRKGERSAQKLDNLLSYKNTTVVINGEQGLLWSVKPGMVIDYYKNDDIIILVLSSRMITDTFNSKTTDSITLGTLTYKISKDYKLYCSVENDNYKESIQAESLLGTDISAYIDYAGFVRYIRPAFEHKNNEFYAIFNGINQNGLSDPQISLYRIAGDGVLKEKYTISEKCMESRAGIIETVKNEHASVMSADSENLNDAIKSSELLYKFEVNNKGEIADVSRVSLFDASPEGGVTNVTLFQGSSTPHLLSPRIYFENANICAFYYDDGEVKVKTVPWSELNNRSCSGIRLDFYAEPDTSQIDVVLLRGDVGTITERSDYGRYGLVTEVMDAYDSETDETLVKAELKFNEEEFTVTKEFASEKGLNKNLFVYYRISSVFSEKKNFNFTALADLNGKPESWSLVEGDAEGLQKGVVRKIDSKSIFFEDGVRRYKGSGIRYYKRVGNGNFNEVSEETLFDGTTIWYVYYNSEIRAVFFE